MLLGLVTDIHNHASALREALALFRRQGVEQVVTLGDSLDPMCGYRGEEEVATLLEAARAVGVWGNHDMLFCVEPTARCRERYPSVLPFMATLRPWLELADCRFSHEEAGIDPFDVLAMWDFGEGRLDLDALGRESLALISQRVHFVGHYHRWWAGTETGPISWVGSEPLHLDPGQRYFIVVAAVMQAWCATYDTDTGMLTPFRCGEPLGE
jgi:hypothetical protein